MPVITLNFNGDWIWVETGHASPTAPQFSFCLSTYWDSNNIQWVGVPGIVASVIFPADPAFNECFPPNQYLDHLIWLEELGAQRMTNWLLLSTNTLVNELNQTEAVLINKMNTIEGTGNGGAAEATIQAIINQQTTTIQNSINATKSAINSTVLLSRNQILDMTTDLALDHGDILNSIDELRTAGGETLLEGIGSLLGGVVDTVTGIIDTFKEIYGNIVDVLDVAITAVESRLKNEITSLVDSVNLAMGFFTAQLEFVLNNVLDAILLPLNALGEISDFLFDEFMEFLKDTFEFSQKDLEEGAETFLNSFRKIVEAYVNNTSFTSPT